MTRGRIDELAKKLRLDIDYGTNVAIVGTSGPAPESYDWDLVEDL